MPTSNDPNRYFQLIKVIQVDPDTLDELSHSGWRVYATDAEAWEIGLRVWRRWMERNFCLLTKLNVSRIFERLED